MIECPNCGRSFRSNAYPIYCDCGEVTNGPVAAACGDSSMVNPWRIIHTRLADAVRSGVWDLESELYHYDQHWLPLIPRSNSCDCTTHWDTLVRQMPIDWSSPAGAFESFWRLHNEVSRLHSGRPLYTLDQAKFLWLGEPPKRARCVVTIATGMKYRKLLDVARPGFRRYAQRCDADYYEITDAMCDDWKLEKFRVHQFAAAYERTLFLDCDCLVRDDCDDLFDLVPEDAIGMHDDYQHLRSRSWLIPARTRTLQSQQMADSRTGRYCLNSGVVLVSRADAAIWAPPTEPLPDDHCAEQFIVEHRARQRRVFTLPTEFNTQWWMRDFESRLPAAKIIHLANCPNRLQLMRRLASEVSV